MAPRPRTVSDDEILEATRDLIRSRGPSVSTDAIGERIGVTGQAILKRFGSRDQLLVAALAPPASPPFLDVLAAGPDDRPFGEQLDEFARAAAVFFGQLSRDYIALRWSAVSIRDVLATSGDAPPAPVAGVEVLSSWLERCAERGVIRQVDAQAVALGLLGSLQIHSLLSHVLDGPPTDHDPAAYVSVIVDVYDRALSPGATGGG